MQTKKSLLHIKNILNLVFFLAIFSPGQISWAQGDLGKGSFERRTMSWQGRERVYFVYLTAGRSAKSAMPVVFLLHGGGGADAHEMAKRTQMNGLADGEGFVVVYPYGVDGQWNDGRGKTFRQAQDNTGVDDVGFAAAILDELIQSQVADRGGFL